MMGFLSGILKTILSPVTKLIFRALYGVFIKGPLWVLNVETKALTYATGAETDRLIFDTSLKDGTGKLNFFATTGVVHDLFMVMISIVGTLIAFTVGLVIVKTLYKGKINPIKKVIQFSMNSTLIFGIPLLFLTGLSLSGALMSALDGKTVAMSSKDITGFKTETRKNSQKHFRLLIWCLNYRIKFAICYCQYSHNTPIVILS